jgi:magnesium chelatase family protein
VGLPDAEVREGRDRVRAAIKNSGYLIPPTFTTINLAPADLKMEGSGFDFANRGWNPVRIWRSQE